MTNMKVHIRFPEDKIKEPVIYQIGHEFKVVTNVRRADVRETTGWMDLAQLTGDSTLMLVFGMLPMALGQGPGAASRASMAKVIIGGQRLCMLLTLLITPVGYSIFDDWGAGRFFGKRLAFRRRRPAPEEVPPGREASA